MGGAKTVKLPEASTTNTTQSTGERKNTDSFINKNFAKFSTSGPEGQMTWNSKLGPYGGYTYYETPQIASQRALKNTLMNSLLRNMPQYEQMGIESPSVLGIRSYLDNITKSKGTEAINQMNNSITSQGVPGSSYAAWQQASLADLLGRQYNQNALTALDTAQNTYGNNIANALKLMAGYTNEKSQFDPMAIASLGPNQTMTSAIERLLGSSSGTENKQMSGYTTQQQQPSAFSQLLGSALGAASAFAKTP